MPTIDWDKPLQTRDGRKVRIYARDGQEPYVVHGATYESDSWVSNNWTIDGSYCLNSYIDDNNDLINTPAPSLDQTCTVTVRDVYDYYGDKLPEAPKGYRFKVEDGKVAFRGVVVGEYYMSFFGRAGHETMQDPRFRAHPRLILEPETTK